ncbi:unnamed protein product [Owenia fusiformis]|uniref:Uncharacterized protein n=1 Tax=Owenia fusiformis TaxID=6347 RepID=A0A8J1U6Q3_OWEFU|nr:unnamed protein product [Owenia fusiformis]
MQRKMSSGENVSVHGFTVLPVKFDEKSDGFHQLFLKEHSVRETHKSKPTKRTLFVLNVPPYCNEECLKRLFTVEDCGKVEDVILQKKPSSTAKPKEESTFFRTGELIKGFKVAYVVFRKENAVQKAIKLPYGKPRILSTPDAPILTGMKKWCQEYKDRTMDIPGLQKEIDLYMEEFDRKQKEEEERLQSQEGVPDEDGWVTVTKFGKNKGIPRTEVQEKRITDKERKKRKDKELLNFYSFQMRESKREHLATLRQKFEEDKQRIAMMKASRKFKPY